MTVCPDAADIYSHIEMRRDKRKIFFPAILVTGPRQSGKTPLVIERFSESHRFVSLENPDIRARAQADPNGFLRASAPPVIFPLIQCVPELLNYIETQIDRDRRPGQSLDEILVALISSEVSISPDMGAVDLAEWILRGGYPGTRTRPEGNRKIWCASYIQTCLERWRRLAGDRATSGIAIADVDEPVVLDRMRGVPWRRTLAF